MPPEVHVVEGLVVPRIPGCEYAWVPEETLKGYALSPEHPRGKHKARVFQSALGIERENWAYLRDQILEKLVAYEAVLRNPDTGYGQEWEVLVPVAGLNACVRDVATKWIIHAARDPRPKLSTLYVEKSARKLREIDERRAYRQAGAAP
jgi:hypothetical protein